jgi:phenylalanyl-tRNA synthetase alpha chain
VLDNTLKLITGSKSLSELESVRVKILGKQGLLKAELKKLKQEKNIDKRKKLGEKLNRLKLQILSAHQKRRKDLLKTKQIAIDPTLPGKKIDVGAIHPVGQTINSVRHIFEKIGFYQVSYPGIEYEYFSFDSLNMPPSHPARDEFESFLVDGPASPIYGKMVLSPHTSSAQVREMWRMKNKPIRMINIARCFRRNWDVTHVPMFHQFEGLCIDKNINITHLKGTIEYFVKEYFGHDVKIRLRPFHFQFTEPSFEIDIACTICHGTTRIKGKKCRVCKGGWLELGGAGMVHPYVLRQGKINPQKFSGWAFGFGVERVYMMKYQLFDLRKLFSGQLDIYESENEY